MNKKEQEEMEQLKTKLALKFTEQVNPDIKPSEVYDTIVNGYLYNSYSKRVVKSCTTKISHSFGNWDKTTTQGSRNLYSTEILAYKAMRSELERSFASQLREIDKKIESLEKSNEA